MTRIAVTGGSGKLGRAVLADLAAHGNEVVNLDVAAPRPALKIDLTDYGQTVEALTAIDDRYDKIDAVVHLAAIPAPGILAEHETLLHNAAAAYLVFNEAGRAGVRRIVAASSFSVVGLAWADRDLSPHYAPVDERHPKLSVDSYGLSLGFTEEIAAFATRRFGMVTVCLRFPFVGTGDRLRRRLDDAHRDPGGGRRDLWAWLDTRDAAGAMLAALTAELSGHHVLNIAAPDTTAFEPTAELLHTYHPSAERRTDLTHHAGLVDTRLAGTLLGFTPRHGWRRPPNDA